MVYQVFKNELWSRSEIDSEGVTEASVIRWRERQREEQASFLPLSNLVILGLYREQYCVLS